MKPEIIALALLGAYTFSTGAQAGNPVGTETANCISALPVSALTTTVTTTVKTTTTDENGNIVKESKITTQKVLDTVSPEDGDYSYLEYDGVLLPYYKGYYYIDGVWVWRGRGHAPIPPPKFRPQPPPKPASKLQTSPAKPAAGLQSSPAKPAAAMPTSANRLPAKTTLPKSSLRRGGRVHAPKPPHH